MNLCCIQNVGIVIVNKGPNAPLAQQSYEKLKIFTVFIVQKQICKELVQPFYRS